jgi:hypothetical protein
MTDIAQESGAESGMSVLLVAVIAVRELSPGYLCPLAAGVARFQDARMRICIYTVLSVVFTTDCKRPQRR